jgi:AraC-like DNA-binding protein
MLLDLERVLDRAVAPTLDTLLRLEKGLSRSCRAIMAEIRAHLIDPDYTLAKMLSHLGAGTSNWPMSAFKAALGITPWRLVQEGRLETAARLLRTTCWRVGDIVIFVGYVDITSFARLFRDWCGMNPARFRERTAAAARHAGDIPCGVFTRDYWRRFWRRELTLAEARELVAYLERLYPAPAIA